MGATPFAQDRLMHNTFVLAISYHIFAPESFIGLDRHSEDLQAHPHANNAPEGSGARTMGTLGNAGGLA